MACTCSPAAAFFYTVQTVGEEFPSMLRIVIVKKQLVHAVFADPECLSRIDLNFSIPDPGSKRFWIPDPVPHQRIKVLLTLLIFPFSKLREI
jgi:hypothetical protein